ncbi:hypothetical protein BC834DRAFT_94492 [Gloeopeniophorella convolvens]|nr:hypothetical protein BC834DRAFT_94492 [Gloeopeniophorella convolvens]
MAFNYYQRNAPGWGTQQFQLGAPPMPNYQPQPTWSGQDFYSAHTMGNDPMIYQTAMSRLSTGVPGVGKHEAKIWHRRAYAGLGEVTRMLPIEVGAAAAYEAYRQIKYGSSIYQFLRGNYERQREVIRGLAVAEAVRLWQDTGRGVDQYGLQIASETAAATANNIITQREMQDGNGTSGIGGGTFHGRRNSFNTYPTAGMGMGIGTGMGAGMGAGMGYAGSGSPYAPSPIVHGNALGGASPLPMGGSSPLPIARSGSPMPYPGSAGTLGVGLPGSVGSAGLPGSYGGGGMAGSYGAPGYGAGGFAVGNNGAYGAAGSSGAYGSVGYPGAAGGYQAGGGYPAAAAPIVLPDRGRRRHHHHHHRRHRSLDRYNDRYGEQYSY